jgi:pyruvate,orthophosphate dikinase
MAPRYVYYFKKGKSDGSARMKDLLGGKGAGLAEMANLGIPVPAGFVITTEVCTHYVKKGTYPNGLKQQVIEGLARVEQEMGGKFGDSENPLLVSVRSGAKVSMPGMMDTVLNIGLNDGTIKGLIKKTGNERFAYDCYRRFVSMYGDVVLGLKAKEREEDPFEVIIQEKKKKRGVTFDIELDTKDLKELVREFKAEIKKKLGIVFPEDPMDQLWGGITAVFKSWNVPRAVAYREIHGIPNDWGTAVNVQAMVFGNMGEDSASGVAFTRNPSTGEKKYYGEYLPNAQGEDVVAGIRNPNPLNIQTKNDPEAVSLEERMPSLYKELADIFETLEHHYKEMEDVEFTIQEGKLWMLQTRMGKRTAQASVKIAVDMVREGLLDKKEAVLRVDPDQLNQLLHPTFDPKAKREVVAKGLPASPGAAVGKVVFSPQDAEAHAKQKEKVILVRIETSPDDIRGMHAAQGILTARGGMTSHAAVVARGMGKPCVAGCQGIHVDYSKEEFEVRGKTVKKGDFISIDGAAGEVILGEVSTVDATVGGDVGTILDWAQEIARLKVRTNADTPHDSQVARNFGAQGIGLCRTEHMFFEGDRINAVREMIVAKDKQGREKALFKILPMQREDFEGIFRVMDGLPVTIRTLDPPLHEFLPHTKKEIGDLAKSMKVSRNRLQTIVDGLHEANPMLGHRGCRLGIVYPEITEMQARAIFEAACEVTKEGKKVIPEIMIPLVGHVREFRAQRDVVVKTAQKVMDEKGVRLDFHVGTMIEIPRAAFTADEIAREAEFFSFGTNDLTQTVFGISRDDAEKFLAPYVEMGIIDADPFIHIDEAGVGQCVKMAVEKGRGVKPDLKLGICGEHGGDPASVDFCHRVGLDYVSCSPFRVPVARLAAAHAVLREKP